MKDYYKILEVNKSASPEIISKVYKLLAKKYHPDMNKENPEISEEKFKDISEAYEILSNQEKRKTYDTELEEYEKQLTEEKNNTNFVPMDTFLKLQEYCKNLEHSIAQLVTVSNNNSATQEKNDLENLSSAELQARLDNLIEEEKQEKKARRIEIFKKIFASIIMLLFILWFIHLNDELFKFNLDKTK